MNIPKFRAWDKTRNIYGQVVGMNFPYNENDNQFPEGHKGRLSLFNVKNEYDCGFWGIWIEKADLEQSSGFKDRNEKEIYQGDRVKVDGATGRSWLGTVELTDGCFSVEYDEMQNDRGDGIAHPRLYVKCFVVNHAIEVVGNIHEVAA